MGELSKEEWRDLILSVGTHRESRRLTPIEVAQYLDRALKSGINLGDLANRVLLKGSTTIHKFLRLLKLKEEFQHLVDWGHSEVKIAWSIAEHLIKLNDGDQHFLITKILEESLNRKEVEQIIQLRTRSKNSIDLCVQDVIRMRPVIEKRYLYIGLIKDSQIISKLQEHHQIDRDIILGDFLQNRKLRGKGRLGHNRFTLVGDQAFARELNDLKPDFEANFMNWLRDRF